MIDINFIFYTHTRAEFHNVQIGLVISPVMSANMIREIGIYWKNPNVMAPGDTLGLYEKDPNFNDALPIFRFAPDEPHGFQKTGISADFIPTSKLTFSKKCLGKLRNLNFVFYF